MVVRLSRWRPAFGQLSGLTGFCLMLQVIENLLDHYRIFNTGNHLHGAAAGTAGLDVDVEGVI